MFRTLCFLSLQQRDEDFFHDRLESVSGRESLYWKEEHICTAVIRYRRKNKAYFIKIDGATNVRDPFYPTCIGT